jgi:hypothetical protein
MYAASASSDASLLLPCTRLPPVHLCVQVDQYNCLIRAIDVTSASVTTLAGRQGMSAPFADGVGTFATFNFPSGVAVDSRGTFAVVVRACVYRLRIVFFFCCNVRPWDPSILPWFA